MNQYVINICESLGKCGLRPLNALLRMFVSVFLLVYSFYSGEVFAITQCGNNAGAGWVIPDGIDDGVGGSSVETLIASSIFDFGDAVGPILSATVSLDVTHSWVGDIDAILGSPDGINVSLFNRPGVPGSFYGCDGDDVVAIFDDAAATGTSVEAICNNAKPTISGTHLPQNSGSNPIADLVGGTANGSWTLSSSDYFFAYTGTLNEYCVSVSAASIVFDKWVSSNATCTDSVDSLMVASGTDVYYCYTVTNVGTEQFVIKSGDAVDDQGIDISGLEGTYAAGVSVTFNSTAIAAGSLQLPFGSTTNIATVTATGDSVAFPASQTLVTDETATLIVALSAPSSGNKILYLDAANLSRLVPATTPNVTINGNNSFTWTQLPLLQSALVINSASGSIPITLLLGESGPGSNRRFTLDLVSSDTGIGIIATAIFYVDVNPPVTSTFNISLSANSNISLPIGSAISLRVTNNMNNTNRRLIVAPNSSFVDLPSLSVINVDMLAYYDVAYSGGNPVTSFAPGETVYIRATVSDPFGSFDITSALLTITDPSSVDVVTATNMTEMLDSGAATKIYEFAYILPNNAGSLGVWSTSVVANEGIEGTVTHSASSTFLSVIPPSLTLVKSSDVSSAVSGGVITYNIQVSNGGGGVATNVSVTDDISDFVQLDLAGGTPFSFIDGGTSSGLSLGTPVYSDDNTTSWIYTPVSGGGGAPTGYDGNVTDWRILMNGNMNAGGSFSLQYQLRVE